MEFLEYLKEYLDPKKKCFMVLCIWYTGSTIVPSMLFFVRETTPLSTLRC